LRAQPSANPHKESASSLPLQQIGISLPAINISDYLPRPGSKVKYQFPEATPAGAY